MTKTLLGAADLPDRLWTFEEAAEFLAVSPRTVRRLVAQGELPSVHIGRAVRLLPSDVAAWVRGRRDADPPVKRPDVTSSSRRSRRSA